MSQSGPTPVREFPRTQLWLQRYPAEELSGLQRGLDPNQFYLFTQFRDLMFVNGGLPDSDPFLEGLARNFGISKYKFRKCWPVVKNFFEKFSGVLVYEEDEQRRIMQANVSAKRKIAGRLGAQSRWGLGNSNSPETAETGRINGGKAYGKRMANDGYREEIIRENTGEPPPPTPSSAPEAENTAGGGSTPENTATEPQVEQNTVHETMPDIGESDFHRIAERAIELGLAAPSRPLAARIRKKFSNLPIGDATQLLIRWEGQENVGLWDSKTRADFEIEAMRQQHPPRKKPTQTEKTRQELIDWARTVDQGS
jgi:hypothetical protein